MKHDRVEELEPTYYYGAIYRYWAIVISELPGIARKITGMSMEKAFEHLQNAIKAEPRFLKNHYMLAEWYLEKKDKAAAKKVLKELLQRDPNALPLMAWENLHYQKKAEKLLAKIWK